MAVYLYTYNINTSYPIILTSISTTGMVTSGNLFLERWLNNTDTLYTNLKQSFACPHHEDI